MPDRVMPDNIKRTSHSMINRGTKSHAHADADAVLAAAKAIKLVIFDVDGVLTNGQLHFIDGKECKSFDSQDGLGIALLLRAGIDVAIISGNVSTAVTARFAKFSMPHIYQGVIDKHEKYQLIKADLQLADSEVAFLGDDLIDLPVMRQVGLPAAVANADAFVKQHSLWVSTRLGGQGAVREFIELILAAQDKLTAIQAGFLTPCK